MNQTFTFLNRSGKGLVSFIPEIARLRIDVFREFPYLYDGTAEYEQNYLSVYVNSPDSIAVLAFSGDELVGVSTGLPMMDEAVEFLKPFTEHGFNLKTIFYCGESILKPEYRGRGIYKTFMHEREQHARNLNRFDTICFCAVNRPHDHPLRPTVYQPMDAAWKKFGYIKNPALSTRYSWKDIDQKEESEKEMVFWLKNLR
jgi:GNAT superfamily N-acetyltransferase